MDTPVEHKSNHGRAATSRALSSSSPECLRYWLVFRLYFTIMMAYCHTEGDDYNGRQQRSSPSEVGCVLNMPYKRRRARFCTRAG